MCNCWPKPGEAVQSTPPVRLDLANEIASALCGQGVLNQRCDLEDAIAIIREVMAKAPASTADDDAPPWPIDREDYHDALRYLIKDLAERNAAIDRIMVAPASLLSPAPGPLTWTKEKPKSEGWYWHRTLPGYVHEPLAVLFDKGVLRYWNVVEESFYDLPPGQWAGPILEPQAQPIPPEAGTT